MPPDRQVYLLDPQKLKPETIAVAFAKTSRSPETFREIASELTEEKSAQFHEKWVVGYGHASVAEHAILHIAVENISRLAVETLESNRLASYTEKSTRYQKWGPDDFYFPPELEGHLLAEEYKATIQVLFDAYQKALPAVHDVIANQTPKLEGESDAAFERRIRSDYVDVCRYLLPAASLANVGMTINARALEHAISKMLSAPLAELRQVGTEMKAVAQKEVPTLVKYANPNQYLDDSRQKLTDISLPMKVGLSKDWCSLVSCDTCAEERILSAALFRFGQMSYDAANHYVRSLDLEGKKSLAEILLGKIGKFEIPLRELEHSNYTFEVVLDQGAYFELKRHRMMTQSSQSLSTNLGYALPTAIKSAGMETIYRQAMESAIQAYHALASFNPHIASYIVPNAFNRRVLLTFNLRSADHLISLRSAPNAHFGIRRVVRRMAEMIRQETPLLGHLVREAPGETWQSVEQKFFAQV